MSLDVGALVGNVFLETTAFDRAYARVVRKFSMLGTEADRAAAGTTALDDSLITTARAADKASTSIGRTTATTRSSTVADERAAAAAAMHARAVGEVSTVMARSTAATQREVQAVLRDVAAQQRAVAVRAEVGSAAAAQARAVARVASAEASAVGSTQRLTAVQREAAVATTRLATSQREAAVAARGSRVGGLAGGVKMAGELGLVIGAFAAVKKAIAIGKEASHFQRDMLLVQTQAGASAREIKSLSASVLGMAGSVGTAPEKLANSLYHVYSVGLRGAKALDVVRIAAEGAKIGNADLEQTTNALTSTVRSGIPGVHNMGQAMGALNTIVGVGDMKLKDLNESLGSGLLIVAKQYGLSLADVGAALAVFGDTNIRGAHAATMLRMSILAMAQPVRAGQKVLDDLGLTSEGSAKALSKLHLSSGTLAKDMQTGGLLKAVGDLSKHLKDSGVTGVKLGQVLTDAFGRKAGPGIAILVDQYTWLQRKQAQITAGAGNFADAWKATTKTTAFAFARLGATASAAGISLGSKLLPAAFLVAHALTSVVSAAVAVGHFLAPVAPVMERVGVAALAMWATFKGYQFAVGALGALRLAMASTRARFASGVVDAQRYGIGSGAAMRGAAAEVELAARIETEAFAQIEASATAAAAAIDRAAAIEAVAYADMVGASKASTDVQVSDADARATAALAAARASQEAAMVTATAAEEASAAVVASGDVAKIGWAGLAGPLGIAAVGVLTIATMFGRSTGASKEATAAAKAYADALKGDGSGATLVDAITKQLTDNNVPELVGKLNSSLRSLGAGGASPHVAAGLAALNKTLSAAPISATQFVTAIQQGGKPLDSLRDKLRSVISTDEKLQRSLVHPHGRPGEQYKQLGRQAETARTLLKHLNDQYDGLSKATKKDLLSTKAFAGVSSSIDKVSQSTKVGSKEAAQYAQMMGILVDKNGVAAVSARTLKAAINTVSTAYNTATSTGSDYLAAVDTFSKSAGTAADRAAMIGATLKANAGDALSFAGSINAAAVAVSQLGKDVSGKLLHQIVNLKSGTIAYSKTAAAPLINDLGSIQTAAISAAQATYQHNVRLLGGKRAADLAVTGYKGVESSLVRQLVKSGLSAGAAQRLTNKYLGVPKNVRTLIEQQGADPVVTVLNKIGRLLATLTGQQWDAKINVTANISPSAIRAENLLNNVRGSAAFRITNKSSQPGFAAGGKIPPNTRFTVGEEGWEGGVTDAQGRATIIPHNRAKAMGFTAPVGYASGTGSNYAAIAALLGSMGATRAGIAGWLGNTSIESGGRTTAHNPGENAWGFQQWEGGRLGTLQAIAARLHVGITSQAAQLAMIRHELTHGYGDTLHMLRTARSPGAAAAYVDANYERSSGAARGARMSAAARFYRSGVSAATAGAGGGVASAVTSQQQLARNVTTAGASLQKVADNTRASVAQLKTAGARLTASAAALHASSAALRQAAGYQRMINADAARRTTLIGRLASAQGAYKAGVAQRAADWTSFVAPTRDSFNISDASQYAAATTTSRQAGATISTTTPGGVSLASILASDKAAAGTARRFGADLSALARHGLNKTDVAALAAAGPSADPVARALLGASRAQIAALNANRTSINSSAGTMASSLAHQLDDAGINAAAGLAHGLTSQIGRLDGVMVRLADHMTSALKRRLKIHSPSQVFHDLGTMLPKGLANGIHEKLPEVRRAAGHMADATMPGFGSGTGGGGFAVHHQTVIHPAPGMSEREIGVAAANQHAWNLQMIGGLPT